MTRQNSSVGKEGKLVATLGTESWVGTGQVLLFSFLIFSVNLWTFIKLLTYDTCFFCMLYFSKRLIPWAYFWNTGVQAAVFARTLVPLLRLCSGEDALLATGGIASKERLAWREASSPRIVILACRGIGASL